MLLCDCHVHLSSYDPQEITGVIQRAAASSVRLIITAGTTIEASHMALDLAMAHPTVYAGVGVHPMRLRGPLAEADLEALERMAITNPRVIVLSETGMDYLPRSPDLAWQEQAFREQIRLAHRLKLPIVWHSQVTEPNTADRHPDTLRILREERAGDLGGVMHYFQADEATAWAAIDAGFFISFAKPLLRQPHQWDIARKLPLEHIVLETDASPQPWKPDRADWTEPKDVSLVAQRLAELKGITVEEVAEATSRNLLKLVGLAPESHLSPS
ncbi:MAG: TatD family hydrolase [Chloroflexi bacterium]|nr:TatD family hydrolase [Chloroflexota bacterium]